MIDIIVSTSSEGQKSASEVTSSHTSVDVITADLFSDSELTY